MSQDESSSPDQYRAIDQRNKSDPQIETIIQTNINLLLRCCSGEKKSELMDWIMKSDKQGQRMMDFMYIAFAWKYFMIKMKWRRWGRQALQALI